MQKIIIGGSSGIGAALARNWKLQSTSFTSFSRSNKNSLHEWQYMDVTKPETFPQFEDAVDTLVYCPGTIVLKPAHLLKHQDFLNDLEINFFGAIRSVQHFLPNLKKAEHSSIIFFSTVAVQTGMPFHASIASAKGALEGLTRSLAAEFAPRIRVNTIALSLTDTPLASRLLDSETKRSVSEERHPLKKVGNADDIAAWVDWLASAKSQFVTGQIIKIDGGISAVKIL